METITFYSYKGGTGRTLAVANVAIYLSRFNLNVCIMDFDLGGPGLHYKFPDAIKDSAIKQGLLDYIYEFVDRKVVPKSLNDFSVQIVEPSQSRGEIRLIPAGTISASYGKKLAAIDWHSLFYEETSEGIPFFLDLKEKIREEFTPDYLLVDSRTGITEMGGICTSILPEKVVFFVVNNHESIEGTRRILRGIQMIERSPNEKPIKAIFALTRVPFPKTTNDKKIEDSIVKSILSFLNEPVEDLEVQLNVQHVFIIHSDRELELSESLSISETGIIEKTPLLHDYLRLFPAIIPDELIVPKLHEVLDEAVSGSKMINDPDGVQQQLENIAASYRHPVCLQKLIDFYILRREKRDKILGVFHDLWGVERGFDKRMFSKYVSLFMNWSLEPWHKPGFQLDIIEEYLKSKPRNRTDVELRLAEAYEKSDNSRMALKYYLKNIEQVSEKKTIAQEVLDIFINERLWQEAEAFSKKYFYIIEAHTSLRLRRLKIMLQTNNLDEAKKELDDKDLERAFAIQEPLLYCNTMEKLGRLDQVYAKITMLFAEFEKTADRHILLQVGEVFRKLNREEEFEGLLLKYPKSRRIITTFQRIDSEKRGVYRPWSRKEKIS